MDKITQTDAGFFGWFGQLTVPERKSFWACFGGWALDAMDVQIYAVLIPTLLSVWHLTKGQAGLLGTSALIVSSIGGWAAGILADRFGRVRVLQITILWFAVFSLLAGFAQNYSQLIVVRSLQGLGFGGEWAAGAALMAETIRPAFRGRAVGSVASGYSIGYGIAALLGTIVLMVLPDTLAWRVLFALGALPAFLVYFVRQHVTESETFKAGASTRKAASSTQFLEIFSANMLGRTVLGAMLTAGALGGNYVMLTWLPTYLKTVQNLSVANTGLYLFVNIVGSFAGHITSAHLSDALGRRHTFLLMAAASIASVLAYTLLPLNQPLVLLIGIPLGFFTSGIVTGIGAWFAELFPTRIRGSGQGFTYNFGRGFGAVTPAFVGLVAANMQLGAAMAIFASSAYALVIVAAFLLPETRGKPLQD
ncbi:MFS transporter [Bradyrhizobium sp. dw_78]|uniref:MFS transporter n=1 Tax=Bradyrhizobium sp. dw_78 TaxID=2719793 RepID=UPI001BD4EE7A|nr:MFS transporter [Bradyrhizobium sp. dw_78]